MKTYIAGKVTGLDDYKELFGQAKTELKNMGITDIVCPIDLPHNHDKLWESYMKECLIAMLGCEQIYLLKNYRESKGAMLEAKLALNLDFNIIYQ